MTNFPTTVLLTEQLAMKELDEIIRCAALASGSITT